MIGQTFGRWTVMAFHHKKPNQGQFWLSKCACGTEKAVRSISMVNGSSKSCGCLNRELIKGRNHALSDWDITLSGEVWKECAHAIRGETLLASSVGRIKNAATSHVYRPANHGGDYTRVSINGKLEKAHKIVADAWLTNPLGLPEINHKDGNKQNPSPSNLEWCTHLENMKHAWEMGLIKPLAGQENGASKLTDKDVRNIRKKYVRGKTRQVDIAAEFGVSQRTISLIVRKESWTHV